MIRTYIANLQPQSNFKPTRSSHASVDFSDKHDGFVKRPINRPRAVKPRPGVRMKPFEFTSTGGGGKTLPRLGKRRILTFHEVIKHKEEYISDENDSGGLPFTKRPYPENGPGRS
jgi:hypothetical protein